MEEYVGKPRMRVAIKITGFGKRWLAWDGRLKKDRHSEEAYRRYHRRRRATVEIASKVSSGQENALNAKRSSGIPGNRVAQPWRGVN